MRGFFHYILRTTDVAAAAAFYEAVLGRADAEIVQLHESALARGARPHWLGFVEVPDVDTATAAFVARGAAPLGPKWLNPEGLEAAVLRDPGGAVIALGKPASPLSATRPEVAWHALNTAHVEQAKANYAELFAWHFEAGIEAGEHGVLYPFAWQLGGTPVGSLSDIAHRPAVHPHWLFHFRVAALDPALEAVQRGGGKALGPFTLPNGGRIAICDDAQGAAFALLEPAA